jgi:hypothetical protein
MANILFELDRLRVLLENKGLDSNTVETIVQKASLEIRDAFVYQGEAAMELAVEKGVDKTAPDFINELRLNAINLELTTDSGNMDFSTPPYPNLANLLRGAKPIKDGSGVYKVIPVGKPGFRPKVSSNIFDAQKQIMAERHEAANANRKAVAPKGSKGSGQQFRTATSKQNANSQWVLPAQDKDFTQDVKDINEQLGKTMDDIIADIIQSYAEGF